MGESEAVARKQKDKVLYARLEPEQHARIKSLIAQAGTTQDRFVLDAVLEKLERGGIATTDVGVLRDLASEDRDLIQWIADLLRRCRDCTLIRDVLVAQKGVLLVVAQQR